MDQRTTLVVAVLFIFGGAMVAEFSGLTDRDLPQASMSESADALSEEGGALSDLDASRLRFGVIGGFVVVCIFLLMRATGEYF